MAARKASRGLKGFGEWLLKKKLGSRNGFGNERYYIVYM